MRRAAVGTRLACSIDGSSSSSLIAARAQVTRQEDTMRAQKTTRQSTRGSTRRPAEKDAIALLKEDHEKVRELLGELEETTSKATSRRQTLLKSIEQELKIHTKIEEEIFYPAFRDASSKEDDKKLYYEALEEHHVVDMVLPEIKKIDAGSDEFAAKAKVLKDLVEHHAEEEETEMFPRARKLMDREELLQLGQQIAQAKESMIGGILTKLTELVRS
jgi:hemerythrin-like domain-containing protein